MNKDFILKRIQPYLNEKNMLGEEDFEELFSILSLHQKYEIIELLIEEGIEIDYENRKIETKKSLAISTQIKVENLQNLSNEQLCVIYKQGNSKALDCIIEKNKKLVWSRVRKYKARYKHKLEEEDLLQYGILGLMKAIERFDIKQETKLSTYAIWWIDQVILRSIVDFGFTIRIPVHYFEQINKLMRVMATYPNYSMGEIFQIYKNEGYSREKFEELLRICENILVPTSLNNCVGNEEESELGDFIEARWQPTVEEIIENKDLKKQIKKVLLTLKEKERKILELRFGLEDGRIRTLEEIGEDFHVTRERIRQIEAKALAKLQSPKYAKMLEDFVMN